MHTLSELTAALAAEPSRDAARVRALSLIESAVTRPALPDTATVAEIRLILVALDAASRPAAADEQPAAPVPADVDAVEPMHVSDIYGALADANDARVEEDAATQREHEAEQEAELDAEAAERTAQLRAEDISADLAADLRSEADSPAELAAIELLIGVGLHEHPAIVRRIGTVSRIAVDWHALAADLDGDAIRDITTDQQWIVLPLACSLGGAGGVPLSAVVRAVRRRPEPAGRDALIGLVLGALRIALTAVTR